MPSLDRETHSTRERHLLYHVFHNGALLWEHPTISAVLAIIVYTGFASTYDPLWHASRYAYFNYLADAFLHGQLHLRLLPWTTHDLSLYEGRYYLYWAPFPAVLLMPFVALFGVGFSDILFTLGIAGLNVALVVILLRQACAYGIIELTRVQRSLLGLFFAFGTVHLTLAPYGRVWFTGQLIGFACVALAYLAAISLRGGWAFALTGLALAGALLTRNHLVLAGLWPAYYLLQQHWPVGQQRIVRYVLAGIAPVGLAIILLGIYNWLRFGNPLDNGLAYHQMAPFFAAAYERYGAFSLHYLPTNFYYQYIVYPLPLGPRSDMGGSLFLLSPVFFAALRGLIIGSPRWSSLMLGITVLLVAIPILLLMGTGWKQWGPRYTLDFTVPLLLLTALGVQRWPSTALVLLIIISVVHYVIGTIYLGTVI